MVKLRSRKLLFIAIVMVSAGFVTLLTFVSCRLRQTMNGKSNRSQPALKNNASVQEATQKDVQIETSAEKRHEIMELEKIADEINENSDILQYLGYLRLRQSIQEEEVDDVVIAADEKVFDLLKKKMQSEKALLEKKMKTDLPFAQFVETLYSIMSGAVFSKK